TTNGVYDGVSCTSSTTCTAVGSYVNGSFATVSLADRWNGTNWVQQATPNPSGTSNVVLRGVSCASATSCMAVGSFFNAGTSHWELLAEQWNGTSWTIKTTPAPAGATFATLNGVSCASATACTAVGGYSTTSPA